MSVSADDVRRVARLAELAVDPSELSAVTAQLDRIVGFVAQLESAEPADGAAGFLAGPPAARLRPDVVDPAPLARPVAALAPEFVDGFFVVPRLGVLDEP